MQSHDFPQGYFGVRKEEPSPEQQERSLRNLQNYKRKHIVEFIKSLPKDAVVLDSGCGKGKTIRLIKFLRPDVTVKGHDITGLTDFLPAEVEFKKCTTEELGDVYTAESFDAIISQHVFEHLVYPTLAMENFLKILKPGGRVLIETPNWTRLYIPFSRLYFWNDYTHIHPFCTRAFERMFSEFGMQTEKIVTASSVDYASLFRTLMGKNRDGLDGDSQASMLGAKVRTKKKLFRRVFDWGVEFLINPLARDILIGVAKKL